MLEREQNREAARQRQTTTSSGAGGPQGGQGCREADAYYNSVDQAIRNAMSVDSAWFNAQVEQPNGQ